MFLALKPSTAAAALKLIEEEGFDMGVDIDDELSGPLLAKDDKGKSKLLELIAASEKEEACAALINTRAAPRAPRSRRRSSRPTRSSRWPSRRPRASPSSCSRRTTSRSTTS